MILVFLFGKKSFKLTKFLSDDVMILPHNSLPQLWTAVFYESYSFKVAFEPFDQQRPSSLPLQVILALSCPTRQGKRRKRNKKPVNQMKHLLCLHCSNHRYVGIGIIGFAYHK